MFTGYGGIDIALEGYVTDVLAYVEIEEYAQRIIAQRMADGSLKRAPILADVRNIRGKIGDCEIIYGGFPCQDISVAGLGRGLDGERSRLFYEIIRLTKEIRPNFVFLENVPAIRTRGLDKVIKSFTEIRYDCRWTIVSASSVGAQHRRERWFFLAHNNDKVWNGQNRSSARENDSKKIREKCFKSAELGRIHNFKDWEEIDTFISRDTDGATYRLDRLKALGNGVVPIQVRYAFEKLIFGDL